MLTELNDTLRTICQQAGANYGGLLTLDAGAELHIIVIVNNRDLVFHGSHNSSGIVDHIVREVSSHIVMERALGNG